MAPEVEVVPVHRNRVLLGGAVAALVAVPFGLARTDDAPPTSTPPGAPPAAMSSSDAGAVLPEPEGPADGYHVEHYRGVSVQVPNTWLEGALTDWCHRADSPGNPVVERPGTALDGRRCHRPRLGYGLQFLGPAATAAVSDQPLRLRPGGGRDALFPPGAWVAVACARCGAAVRVVTPDRYVGRYVMSTIISTRG